MTTEADPSADSPPAPVVAIVGRPNVGKSTLVNRVLGRRAAVVEDVPGVTRDRVQYDAVWRGRRFHVVDTGGWEPDARGLAARVAEQARIAAEAADAVVLVVDATVGTTETDLVVARLLQRSGKPVVLAANKVDDTAGEAEAAALWGLGLGQPYPVSALHGRGSGDLLDAVLDALPTAPADRDAGGAGPRRVALLGRPNVGKSSLFNRLVGSQRVLVDDVAGTTRDPVDSMVDLGGEAWLFVDTAGLRRRVREASGAEYYSSVRTASALAAAEVAVVLVDASAGITEADQRVVSAVTEAGRALVLAVNKWDLIDDETRRLLERGLERDLAQVGWAPRVNISALTGRAVDRLAPALRTALGGWDQRVATGPLNAWLGELVAATPPPTRSGKVTKVLFATQATAQPPRVVVFASGPLEAGYRRFLERRLRERFGFAGTPVDLVVRARTNSRSRH